MSDQPLFIYVAAYDNPDDTAADYATLLDLRSAALVGSYDVAIIGKDEHGKVHVSKHEKPTQHGARDRRALPRRRAGPEGARPRPEDGRARDRSRRQGVRARAARSRAQQHLTRPVSPPPAPSHLPD
jgi:hypothetical protein